MFWDLFVELCLDNDVSPSKALEDMDISTGVITRWKKGTRPNATTQLKIARYFNVTVDELLNGKKEKPAVSDELSEYAEEIEEIVNAVPEDKREAFLAAMKQFADTLK